MPGFILEKHLKRGNVMYVNVTAADHSYKLKLPCCFCRANAAAGASQTKKQM